MARYAANAANTAGTVGAPVATDGLSINQVKAKGSFDGGLSVPSREPAEEVRVSPDLLSFPTMIPDSVPEVLAPADHPSPQGPPVVLCNGPTGPCVLELGHGGDHIRPLRTTEEDVIEGIRALKAENAELRRLLKTAGILLADWQQRRGGFLRRGLVQRIAEVLA